jgi:hypothetical protein
VAAAAGLPATAAGIDDVVDASPDGAAVAVVAGPLASTVGDLDACFDPEEQAPVNSASTTRTAPALREITPLSSSTAHEFEEEQTARTTPGSHCGLNSPDQGV